MLRVNGRSAPLVRALVTVLSIDVSATSVLVASAFRVRARPCAAAFSGVAVVATASLLPGFIAVLREVHAHVSPSSDAHRIRPTKMLFITGMLINTAGTLLVLPSTGPPMTQGSAARRADLLLLAGGDLIGVPYLAIVSALHADVRS